jgi:eukaryotic-like serine/threonine-protein kinase
MSMAHPSVARAAHYIRQAATALHHLFERGVVHRDIKPSDILVDRGGSVKIIDFGLARERDNDHEQENRLEASNGRRISPSADRCENQGAR